MIQPHDVSHLEACPHVVYDARQAEPPQQGAADDACKSEQCLRPELGFHEVEARKQRHEEEDDERIAQRYGESR